MSIPYIHLEINIETEFPIHFHFPEALIRGGFGNVLRNLVCVNKKSECKDCFLMNSCIFSIMFFTDYKNRKGSFSTIKTIPHPYIFHSHRRNSRNELIFEMILFRDCFKYFSHIIYALMSMGETGIGKNRIKFKINQIKDNNNGEIIFEEGNKGIKDPIEKDLSIKYDKADSNTRRMKIEFVSPMRIIRNNKMIENISFKDVIKSGLLRIGILDKIYGEESDVIDLKNILNESEKVKTIERNLYYKSQRRYSTVQDQKIEVGGYMGSMTYEGKTDKFESILKCLLITGTGKSTSFGCGRINYYFL